MDQVVEIDLEGFKSIKSIQRLPFRSLSVLIGSNGSGKSNLISFFKLLRFIVESEKGLQDYFDSSGGETAVFHDGIGIDKSVCARVKFHHRSQIIQYSFRISKPYDEAVCFSSESFRFEDNDGLQEPWQHLGSGHTKCKLITPLGGSGVFGGEETIRSFLRQIEFYQFHDTSVNSGMRKSRTVDDYSKLQPNGSNLAPYLLDIQSKYPKYYYRIIQTIKLALPFLSELVLAPVRNSVELKWKEHGCSREFSSIQASDGMLRAIALITLLQQPTEKLPNFMMIEEPELGLHPTAISIISGLLKTVSTHKQVLVATQSPDLIDNLDTEDVVVVERKGRESLFNRLEGEALQEWLKEYSLSQLWKKNVLSEG